MNFLFMEYPKCSTCQKAKKWLDAHGVSYDSRSIVEQNPSAAELKRFFNTSGRKYQALGLKDRLPQMSEAEQLELLATDGMLVKRPLLVGSGLVLAGFREKEWEAALEG